MNVNRDIERLRHIENRGRNGRNWKDYRNAVNAIVGSILVGGVVQALLLAMKDKAGSEQKRVAGELTEWLQGENAHCRFPGLSASAPLNLGDYTARLIKDCPMSSAMAVQSEALRYLAQAKLVANAHKDQTSRDTAA